MKKRQPNLPKDPEERVLEAIRRHQPLKMCQIGARTGMDAASRDVVLRRLLASGKIVESRGQQSLAGPWGRVFSIGEAGS